MNKFLGKLPERFQWTVHNLLGHPLSEISYQLGNEKLGNWFHDMTIPEGTTYSQV